VTFLGCRVAFVLKVRSFVQKDRPTERRTDFRQSMDRYNRQRMRNLRTSVSSFVIAI